MTKTSSAPKSLQSSSPLKTISLSFLCGCFGGVANIITSHPLDTIKVRMQILDTKLANSFKNIVSKEGPIALYKGITSPLFNVPLIYALYFGAYEAGKWMQGIRPNDQMEVSQAVISGSLAGLAVCAVMTPVELVKCRLQMQGTGMKGKTMTAFALAKKIVRAKGLKGLYRGNLITICREVPAMAAYFGTYEYLSKEFRMRYGESGLIPVIAGGVAGLMSWIISYPQDVIKTKLQCETGLVSRYANARMKDGGIVNCTKEIWKANGARGFTRGFSACSIKAIIAEASTFFVYENLKTYASH